jgi:hypothetical protein
MGDDARTGDDAAMHRWWKHIGKDAREAWCAVAADQGAISAAMIRSIDISTAEAGVWLIMRSTAWEVDPTETPDCELRPTFRAFIEQQCSGVPATKPAVDRSP